MLTRMYMSLHILISSVIIVQAAKIRGAVLNNNISRNNIT